jgi:hypothetical protein
MISQIKQDAITDTEQAIDKLVIAIGDHMADHNFGKPVVNAQINQDLTAYRMLVTEWKELKNDSNR